MSKLERTLTEALGWVAAAVLSIFLAFVISGCANKPRDVIIGEKVAPPKGCIDQRARDPKAGC